VTLSVTHTIILTINSDLVILQHIIIAQDALGSAFQWIIAIKAFTHSIHILPVQITVTDAFSILLLYPVQSTVTDAFSIIATHSILFFITKTLTSCAWLFALIARNTMLMVGCKNLTFFTSKDVIFNKTLQYIQ
jgi:hypothetical protein